MPNSILPNSRSSTKQLKIMPKYCNLSRPTSLRVRIRTCYLSVDLKSPEISDIYAPSKSKLCTLHLEYHRNKNKFLCFMASYVMESDRYTILHCRSKFLLLVWPPQSCRDLVRSTYSRSICNPGNKLATKINMLYQVSSDTLWNNLQWKTANVSHAPKLVIVCKSQLAGICSNYPYNIWIF